MVTPEATVEDGHDHGLSVRPATGHMRHQHRDLQGGAARAAVFGVSDGLLTNVSLILGMAGAVQPAALVRLVGLGGLLAGAFSMAAGEYVSMSAQSELMQHELRVERGELERHPEAEIKELAEVYSRRGLTEAEAMQMSRAVMRDPEMALEVHAREEMGINPAQTGKPLQAAASSFVSFAFGALIPLLPWFFIRGAAAIIGSALLVVLAALAIGWTVAVFTGRSRLAGAARQLGIAAVAAGVTFALGRLIGVHLS